jgi:hypothetical protein
MQNPSLANYCAGVVGLFDGVVLPPDGVIVSKFSIGTPVLVSELFVMLSLLGTTVLVLGLPGAIEGAPDTLRLETSEVSPPASCALAVPAASRNKSTEGIRILLSMAASFIFWIGTLHTND